ncbi:hypothetical protein GIB67_017560 [Kingdonia uniflora]|uniref:Protein FAR1-RELATED SEQUENCE n=1 Tax=Kingdonia uniflora TaxID=39325 RepID=A0A7J7LN21_9MAGN|nr:hypothetical protein GIB67_017560 [Kingdonia uniflora]
MLDDYGLGENIWLGALFKVRKKWALTYGCDVFCVDMTTTQRSESINKFLKKFVKRKYSFSEFLNRFEMALETRHQTEVEEDFKSSQTSPSLVVPTLMLKQASERYTHNIFDLFSDEYKAHLMYTIEERDVDGSIFRYEVSQEGRTKNIVMIDSSNIQVGCTCNKFEFTEIICRHIVKVLYHGNIHEILSKYILARWTKDVKAGIVRDEVGKTILANCNANLSLRYNVLCAQAIKITTKGAINEEVYAVAMRVLKNGLEEVKLATGLPHKDSVENPKSTKANASQSDEVKVKEILTVAQGCERGHPPGTRLKNGLELSQKKKNSKTTRTDSSNSNVRKHHTSPQQNEDLRQCDTMLIEATCSEKNAHLSKSNARKHPTSPHQNEVLGKCDTMPIEATCLEKDVHSSTNEENVILNPTLHAPTYYPSQIVQPLVP